MIGFEDALQLARERKPNIDYCIEYKKGYRFGFTGDQGDGGPGPVVILKKDGRAVSMPYFVGVVGTGGMIRELEL